MLLTCLSIPAQKKEIGEKILVVYFSHSGNTRTVTEQITRWSTIAPPVATFLERHDFSGKTIVPFMTHGGGRFGHSISDMKKLCPDASSSEGLAIRDSYVNDNCQDVVKWLQTLKLLN